MHTFSLSIWAAQADGPVQPSLHNETLSQRKRKEKNLCVSPYMWVWVCAHKCRTPQKPEVLDSLELELQEILSHLTECWETELGTTVRAVCVLTHWAMSPVSWFSLKKKKNSIYIYLCFYEHFYVLRYAMKSGDSLRESCGSWRSNSGLNSGHKVWATSFLISWPVLPNPVILFKNYFMHNYSRSINLSRKWLWSKTVIKSIIQNVSYKVECPVHVCWVIS